jgi:hypothetical protein
MNGELFTDNHFGGFDDRVDVISDSKFQIFG